MNGEFRFLNAIWLWNWCFVRVCVGLVTHDMGLDTPLALDQDRRCRTPEAVQNTAEEGPRRGYCGDTASKEGKERQMSTSSKRARQILEKNN